jgi:cytochrome c biogenesis protein CcmG, thiol:disulfide interchange protein DsbE
MSSSKNCLLLPTFRWHKLWSCLTKLIPMKQLILIISLVLLIPGLRAQESPGTPLPSVVVKTMDGRSFSTDTIHNGGKPVIICFWATWCKPCLQELVAIAEVYEEWQKETGVVIYAISIDDSKTSAKVPSVVNGRGWEYMVLLDANQDFKRSMGVNNPPHTFILDSKGQIVWQHTGYLPGDEEEYIEMVRKIYQID